MKRVRRILVGLKTPQQALELVDIACRQAAKNASLLLVHVIELPDVTPLTAEVPELEAVARKTLQAGARIARRSGVRVRTLDVRAHSAGEALLELLKEEKIELAVLGYHHKKTLGEILIGTTSQRIARHAPCDILLHIPPVKSD